MTAKPIDIKYISKDPIKEFEVSIQGNIGHKKCNCPAICNCYICGCQQQITSLLIHFGPGNYRDIDKYKIIQCKDPQLGNISNLYTMNLKKVLSKIYVIYQHINKPYYYFVCLNDDNKTNKLVLMKDSIITTQLVDFKEFTHVLKDGNFVITTTNNKIIIVDDELTLNKKLEFIPRCYEHPDIYPVIDSTGNGIHYYNAHTDEIIDKVSNTYFVFWNGNKAYEHKANGENGIAPYWLQTREFVKKIDLNKYSMNCAICMTAIDKQTCLIPYGHSQFCATCIDNLLEKAKFIDPLCFDNAAVCPICQKQIVNTLRIFLN